MKVQCRLEFAYSSKAEAENVAKSLKVDDESWIRTKVAGRTLVADAKAESFMSLLHTLEDYLACLAVAERVLRG